MCGGGQTTVSSSQPPQVVLDAYNNLINRGTQVANAPLEQYSGPLVAGFTPQQNEAFSTIENTQGIANPYINAAAQYAAQGSTPITPTAFSADQVSKYLSPYTQDVINATQANINESNAEQQQQLAGNAISKGAFGGDRMGVAQAELARQQGLAADQTLAGLENQNYTQALGEFNTQQQTGLSAQQASDWLAQQAGFQMGALGNEAQNTALTGAQAELGAGSLEQQLAQQELNIPYEQFLQQQAYPFQTTNFLAGITEGAGSGMGGSSSTTAPGPDPVSQVAGLGLTGAAIASLFLRRGGRVPHYDNGGLVPGFGPIGADIPDVSVSVVPTPVSLHGPGAPPPPKPVGQQGSGMPGIGDIAALKGLFGKTPGAGATGYMGTLPGGFGEVSSGDMLGDLGYGALPVGSDAGAMTAMMGMRRGGIAHMADGGVPMLPTHGPIAGFTTAPARNIQIPVLANPGRSAGLTPVDIRPTSFYSPPSAAALPHTTIPLPSNVVSAPPFNPPPTVASAPSAGGPSILPPEEWAEAGLSPGGSQYGWRGGRIHHAIGGIVLPESGAHGFDYGGSVMGNPMTSAMLRQFSQMPTEKLQELAVRMPPTSAQGALLRRALQMRHMNPMSDPAMQQQAGLGQPTQPAMYRGGIAGFADGGSPDATDMVLDDTGNYVPLSQAQAVGDGTDDVQMQPLPPPSQPPANAGTDIIPPPQPGLSAPPPTLAGDQPSALNPSAGMTPPPARPAPASGAASDSHDFGSSPWLPVLAAGLGMLSSRSPNALQAIGEGGLMGVRELAEQRSEAAKERQIQNEAQYHTDAVEARKQGYDIEAKRLADQADATKQRLGLEGKRIDLENQRINQDRYTWQPGMGQDPADPTKQIAGAWRFSMRGDEEPKFYPGAQFSRGSTSQLMPKAITSGETVQILMPDGTVKDTGIKTTASIRANTPRVVTAGSTIQLEGSDGKMIDTGIPTTGAARVAIQGKNADTRQQQVNQGHFTYQQGEGDDGTGHKVPGVWQLDSSGQHEPRFLPQVTITGKGNSQTSVFEQKRRAWLQIHPNDQQGALDYGAGHRQMTDQDIMKSARTMADNELKSMIVPPSDPSAWLNQRAAQIAQQIKGGAGGTTQPAPAPASQAAPRQATPQAAPAAKPQAAAPKIPPLPQGVPPGAKYSPSQNRFWWQQGGKWTSAPAG